MVLIDCGDDHCRRRVAPARWPADAHSVDGLPPLIVYPPTIPSIALFAPWLVPELLATAVALRERSFDPTIVVPAGVDKSVAAGADVEVVVAEVEVVVVENEEVVALDPPVPRTTISLSPMF
jgi:hypothetical protein